VFQSAFGEDVYPSVESKATHLLYFIVKNHPFNDGNKRNGAFAFIRFLQQTNYASFS
jgi:prophage maintenance system killer protein